jgi:hypothetical protein
MNRATYSLEQLAAIEQKNATDLCDCGGGQIFAAIKADDPLGKYAQYCKDWVQTCRY